MADTDIKARVRKALEDKSPEKLKELLSISEEDLDAMASVLFGESNMHICPKKSTPHPMGSCERK